MRGLKTTGRVELGGAGAAVRGPAGAYGGAPACDCGGRAGRGLELEDIAEGVAGLVLNGDDGPVCVVEEVIGDLWQHGGGSIQPAAAHKSARAREKGKEKRRRSGRGDAGQTRTRTRTRTSCADADSRRRSALIFPALPIASRSLGFPSASARRPPRDCPRV